MTRHSSFAYTAAAVLVLVGFSAAFAGLSAATDTAAAGTEKGTDPAFGGEELPAAEEFGGDSPGSSPDFLVLFEITATTDSLTLTAIVALDPEAVLDVSGITATAEHYADYLTDHLGSTRKVLDMPDPLNPPAVTFSAEYTPFGEPYAVEGTEGFRFTGEQHDAATGFTHLRARQYDPVTGRFASEDPLAGSAALPQTQNPYAYAVNDPVGFSDPSGTCIWDLCIGEALLVLAIIGIVAAVATHHASPQARLAGDMIMMEVGTVPIFGDVLSTACYLTQDALDCAEGHCDPLAIGLDAIGIVPGVPNAGGGAHVLGAFPSPGSLGHAAGHGVGAGAMGVGVFPLYTRVTGGAAQAGTRMVGHHTIPRQILKSLPSDVAAHPLVRGIRGHPNIWDIPESLHIAIHKGPGGGLYNARWFEELDAIGTTGRGITVGDVLRIRFDLAQEFGLMRYAPSGYLR